MAVTAQMVKELRERTGAGMMDCKNALVDNGGDIDKAVDALRKKGLSQAAKKAGRATSEGAVGCYIHAGGKIGVMVEINCETDFVARTDEFQALVSDIAMHVAAAEPRYLSRDEVTDEILDRERAIFRDQALAEGKPEKIVDRIVDGKVQKYLKDICLVEQAFVKDPDRSVGDLLGAANATVRGFERFKLGQPEDEEA